MTEIKEIQIDAKDLDKGSIVTDYDESCVVDWKGFDNQADMQYIKECVESVGMDVTDRTAFTIPFIAEVIRRINKFNRGKEVYTKGYKDGLEALALHYELCKEEGSVITVPEGTTNGEVAMQLFGDKGEIIKVCTYNDKLIGVKLIKDWWNSPYRKEN